MIVIILKLGVNTVMHLNVTLYIYFMTKAMPANFVWFRVYVFNCMFYMTVSHIYGLLEIIKNE